MRHYRLWSLLALLLRGASPFAILRNKAADATTTTAATITAASAASVSPVIGILSQPGWNSQNHFIAASYVKWLEAGGARSIPIPYDAPPALLDDLFGQINGLLLPGGRSDMPPGVPYLLDQIVDSNNRGHYFPVWGTCLGFEFLLRYVGGDAAVKDGFKAENISLPLESVRVNELYADPATYMTVVAMPVTMNNHHQGIEPALFLQNDRLTAVWNITSINHDEEGRPFVSTIEPVDPQHFPLFGVQYHPEKNAFEYSTVPGTNIPYEAIDHSEAGVAFSVYVARFFVDRVRHALSANPHHGYTKSDLYPTINSYPVQTGLKFEQVYIIPKASHWNQNTTTVSATASSSSSSPQSGLRGSGGHPRDDPPPSPSQKAAQLQQ